MVAMIRSGVREICEGLLERTIYACGGYGAYLHDLIQSRGSGEHTAFYVHTVDGAVAGSAEFREHPDALFANSLFVLPEFRNRFINCELLAAGTSSYSQTKVPVLMDVLDTNLRVLRGYLSFGAVAVDENVWLEADLDERLGRVKPRFSGLAESKIIHRRYGFSRFTALTASGEYAIGCMGDRYFRSTSLGLLGDREALSMLRELEGGRKVLCLTSGTAMRDFGGRMAVDAREVARFQRLRMSAAELHQRCAPFCSVTDA
jgi:hypothetical protein